MEKEITWPLKMLDPRNKSETKYSFKKSTWWKKSEEQKWSSREKMLAVTWLIWPGAGPSTGMWMRLHPSNRDALPKTYMKILNPLPKTLLNSWVHPQNPHEIPWFVPKIKIPVRVCTHQTKILGPSLDLAHKGLGFLYGMSSKAKLYTFCCNRLFQTRGAHCMGGVLRTEFIPCSF